MEMYARGAPGLHGGWYEHSGGGAGVRTAPGHGEQDAEVLGASRVSSKIAAAPGLSWTRTGV